MRLRRLGVVAAVLAAAILAQTAAAAGGGKVVVNRVNNPRGLAIGPDGHLYIAAAGRAGSMCFGPDACAGLTSSVLRVSHGNAVRIARGLPSVGGQDGSFTVGVDGVSVSPQGRVFMIETSAGENPPPGIPHRYKRLLGNLLMINSKGNIQVVADIDDFEFRHDPDHQGVDSDPYSVLALSNRHQLVTDAAGNSLLDVRNGKVSLLATFPNNRWGAQSVPTSVARGPDGAYYVGELGGEGTPNHGSRVWRVVPGHRPRVYARGFTATTGLGFGPDGSMYVTELTTDYEHFGPNGAVIRVEPNGHRQTLGGGILHFPAGVAVNRHGRVFVSNWSIAPAHPDPASGLPPGQVVRLP
jgi:hypothetical protein